MNTNQEIEASLQYLETLSEINEILLKSVNKYDIALHNGDSLSTPFLNFENALYRLDIEIGVYFVELLKKYRSSEDYYLSTLADAILEDRLDKIKAIITTTAPN